MAPVRERWPSAAGSTGDPAGLDAVRLALQLEVPTDVRLIGRIVQLVSRQARELEFPSTICSLNVPVALSEALSNAMLRGNKEDPAKRVRIRVMVEPAGLVIEITDEGRGFDLEACTQRSDHTRQRRPRRRAGAVPDAAPHGSRRALHGGARPRAERCPDDDQAPAPSGRLVIALGREP